MTTPPVPTLRTRLARIAPFFRGSQWGFVLAVVGTVIAAATEPAVPALVNALLDKGFQSKQLPLWMIPVAVIGLFTIRGVAGFVAQYGLAWASNRGIQGM